MKQFYADVYVIKKERERVSFEAKKKPTKKELLALLQGDSDFDCEITDNESLEYIEVYEVEYHEQDDEE